MGWKDFWSQLNFVAQCRKYRLSIWQCPQFLFLLMGVVTIAIALITYALGTRYVVDPAIVSLIVLAVSIVLFVITFSVTRSMEGLAEANQLKSEFISIVSHQLRSPLSNLKWSNEFLMSGRLGKITEKQAEYLKILRDNTSRMEELIADLLTVSRLESGNFHLEKSEFSLDNLVQKIIVQFQPLALSLGIEVKLEAVEELPKTLADPSRIKMVIENLLDNALRYTQGKGTVVIKLGLKNKDLLFTIKDSGVGIPQADQKHIFERFFRSGNILKRQTRGSGLGLYIAKAVIEKSGGKIGFQSKENKGSTFWFTLPTK